MSRIALSAAAIPVAVVALAAQAPQPAPSFTAGVELARLDVRVTDANRRPIPDLKQNEVEVVEDGHVRPVVLFQHIAMPDAPPDEVATRTVSSEVSTNQGAARGHLYVLVFDQIHITPGNEQRARQAAERFLKTRVRPGDRVALYTLPGPGPEIGFTADAIHAAGELIKVRGMAESQMQSALGSMTMQEAFAIIRGDQLVLQRVTDRDQLQAGSDVTRAGSATTLQTGATSLSQAVQQDAERLANQADTDSRRMLAMFSDLLRPMAAIEGRKTILFLSEGFYGDRLPRDIEQVAAAAAQSYSVIEAIDLNRRDLDARADTPTGGDRFTAIQDHLAPLGSLAAETSGTLINDASDRMDDVFDQIGEEAQDYYLVGFTPADTGSTTRYHHVTVRVSRPGARVSTRTGFAVADPKTKLTRREAIDSAFTAPFAQQALAIQYTTYVLAGSASGAQRVFLSLSSELPLASATEKRPADIVFVVRALGDGHVAASGTDTIALPSTAAPGSTMGAGSYHVQFELPPGDYLMRAVVRAPDGLVGSADRKFTVRALDGPALTSGDLVLGGARGELPVRPTAYTGDGLSGALEIYGRTADQVENARVAVDLVPLGEAAALVSGFADLQPVRPTSEGVAREARLSLPLTGIAPGRYIVRATTKDGSETAAQVVREVDVLAGRRPAVAAAPVATEAALDPRELVNGALAHEYLDRLANTPEQAGARSALDRLGARDYTAAITGLNSVLTAEDGHQRWSAAATAFYLGWAYHLAGQDRDAISTWRRAAYLDPTIVPVHLALADLYVELSQPALAVQVLRAGLTALPQSPELRDRLSRLGQP